uniref:Uncharacterized protein n=1 Tax=Sphaerodactylus townsendi TaxID=933632 RepID=A0ACB8EPA3_9SAUR
MEVSLSPTSYDSSWILIDGEMRKTALLNSGSGLAPEYDKDGLFHHHQKACNLSQVILQWFFPLLSPLELAPCHQFSRQEGLLCCRLFRQWDRPCSPHIHH